MAKSIRSNSTLSLNIKDLLRFINAISYFSCSFMGLYLFIYAFFIHIQTLLYFLTTWNQN